MTVMSFAARAFRSAERTPMRTSNTPPESRSGLEPLDSGLPRKALPRPLLCSDEFSAITVLPSVSSRRPSPLLPKADIAVLRASFSVRVVGVGHHPHRDDVRGFLAEGTPVVLEHVAPELAPLAAAAAAPLDGDHLASRSAHARGDGTDRGVARPDIHEHRVRQPRAGERFVEPRCEALANVEPVLVAMEGYDQARRRVIARGDPGVGMLKRLQDAPAPLDHRMARRIDADAPVQPPGRAVRIRFEHHLRIALDEAILGARRERRNDEGAPVARWGLARAPGGEPRRFDESPTLARKLGDDRGRSEQLLDWGAGAAGECHAASERRRIAEEFCWKGQCNPPRPSPLGPKADIAVLRAGFLVRVAGIGHHPHRDDVPGFLAEGEPIVLEHVAPELAPLADAAAAAFDDDRLDLAGGEARGDGADRGVAGPGVHDDRVRHLLARQRLVKPEREAVADVQALHVAMEGDDHARRRVVARGD